MKTLKIDRFSVEVFSFLLVMVLIGAFLRFYNLGYQSINLDESQSVWQASHSPKFIIDYMVQNVHLPLYNLILHYWMLYFGSSETVLRFLSAASGLLCIPAMYLLAKQAFGDDNKALAASAFAAISPFWVWYSREIRMYALLTLLTILSYYLFLKILQYPKLGDLLIFTIVNTVGIYIHYFYWLVLLVELLFFFIAWRFKWINKKPLEMRNIFLMFLSSATVMLLAYMPWIAFFARKHSTSFFEPALTKPTSFDLVLSLFQFLFGYQPVSFNSILIALWPLVTLIGFVFLARRYNPFTPAVYFFILALFIPISLVFTISILYKPIFLPRYLIMASPPLLILIAWMLFESRGTVRRIGIVVYLALISATLYVQMTDPNVPEKENYRDAAQFLDKQASVRDIIVVSPPYTLYPLEYYYNGYSKVVSMPIWDRVQKNIPVLTPDQLKRDSSAIQKGHARIFLVSTLNLNGGYAVQRYLDYHYTKIASQSFSQFVHIDIYQSEYPFNGDSPISSKTL